MAVFAFESEDLAACTVDVGLRIKLFPGPDILVSVDKIKNK